MNYVLGLLVVLFSHAIIAGQCRVNGGPWLHVDKSSISINIPIKATPGADSIRLDGYHLECRYTPDGNSSGNATDYWHTVDNALVPGHKFVAYKPGLSINGNRYSVPVKRGIHIVSLKNNGVGIDLKTFMYLSTQGGPGNPISIHKGDLLGTVYLKQTNNTGAPLPPTFRVYLYAANSLIIEPSTCTINANKAIDVNFDNVDPALLGESASSSPVIKGLRLNYSCPDSGVSMPVTITLKGAGAVFNSGLLAMSHMQLGTGLLRGGVLIGPGSSFLTRITNSAGSDDVTFVLVRQPRSFPAPGPFTGSGTLVMGVP